MNSKYMIHIKNSLENGGDWIDTLNEVYTMSVNDGDTTSACSIMDLLIQSR